MNDVNAGDVALDDLVEGEDFIVRREHGQDLAVTMGDTLFPSLEVAIVELVANSYDADATRVDITYEPENDLLVIVDNAEGMDPEGVCHFFRLGDSPKSLHSKTEKGRRQIGNFGIATLAVRALGRHFYLDTFKDGYHYSAEERFGHGDRDNIPIPIRTKKNKTPREHGTTLVLKELNFSEVDGRFNIETLRDMLRYQMPIDLEDFDIYVNQAIIRPKGLIGATEYVLDTDDKLMGEVRGSIFCTKGGRVKEGHGIYTKVNGRAVGGNNLELISQAKAGLASRIRGVVHVDEFADSVKFDRSGFVNGPKKRKLEARIKEVLKQIRADTDGVMIDEKVQAARERFKTLLPKMGKLVGQLVGDNETYEFMFDSLNAGDLIYLDMEQQVVYVNPTAAPFRLSGLRPNDVQNSLKKIVEYAALLHAIPISKQSSFEKVAIRIAKKNFLDARSSKRRYTLDDLTPKRDGKSDEEYDPALRISPNRLFTYKEASQRTPFTNPVLKRLIKSGVLHDRDEKLLGKGLLEAKVKLGGYVSLYDAVRQATVPEGIKPSDHWFGVEATANNKLTGRQKRESLPGYVINVAPKGGEPFFAVRKGKLDTFITFLNTWQFPLEDYKN